MILKIETIELISLTVDVIDRQWQRINVKTKTGSHYRTINKKLESPLLSYTFRAKVKVTDKSFVFRTGNVYVCENHNKFFAINDNEITNVETTTERFNLPTQLVLISNTHIAK